MFANKSSYILNKHVLTIDSLTSKLQNGKSIEPSELILLHTYLTELSRQIKLKINHQQPFGTAYSPSKKPKYDQQPIIERLAE